MTTYVGIDPGPTNTGIAVFSEDFIPDTKVIRVKTTKGASFRGAYEIIRDMTQESPSCVTIERFVPYKGIPTDHAEVINQFIGFLIARFEEVSNVRLIRATDWKTQLCKYQFYMNKFRNPSESFDKKYSFAVMNDIFGDKSKEVKTDHEADASCLAYVGFLKQEKKVKFPTTNY